MKLKRLLPICTAALMMVGCFWEAENKIAHYIIANSTDREITLRTYYENDTGDIIWKDCLVIEPGGEGETTNGGSMGEVPPPFSGSNRILLSDGERTVLFRKDDYEGDGNDFLFKLIYYQKIKYKRPYIWYKYTITEADFERGIPVDNE